MKKTLLAAALATSAFVGYSSEDGGDSIMENGSNESPVSVVKKASVPNLEDTLSFGDSDLFLKIKNELKNDEDMKELVDFYGLDEVALRLTRFELKMKNDLSKMETENNAWYYLLFYGTLCGFLSLSFNEYFRKNRQRRWVKSFIGKVFTSISSGHKMCDEIDFENAYYYLAEARNFYGHYFSASDSLVDDKFNKIIDKILNNCDVHGSILNLSFDLKELVEKEFKEYFGYLDLKGTFDDCLDIFLELEKIKKHYGSEYEKKYSNFLDFVVGKWLNLESKGGLTDFCTEIIRNKANDFFGGCNFDIFSTEYEVAKKKIAVIKTYLGMV